jgi:hypothetical protein
MTYPFKYKKNDIVISNYNNVNYKVIIKKLGIDTNNYQYYEVENFYKNRNTPSPIDAGLLEINTKLDPVHLRKEKLKRLNECNL